MTTARPGLALVLLLACSSTGRPDDTAGAETSAGSQTGVTAGTTMQAPTTGAGTDASASATGGGSGDATSGSASGTTLEPGTTGVGTGTSTGTTEGVGSSTSNDPKLDFPPEMPIPVNEIPGLVSITFYETTGMVMEYTFAVDGPELNNLLPDPLSMANRDIQGTSVEFYDVYYSDIDGVFDPLGSYLTIAGSFGAKLPAGGGLNLAEISLNFDNNEFEFGSYLASFVGLGDNYAPGTEPNAIDNNLATHTTMGNNVDTPDQRLRVTLGFKSSLMPG
jgi:hypothetical protein